MGKVDFGATRKAVEKEGLIGGGDYFKFKEGANRMRLLSECLPHPGEYKGTPNFKWLCYILDREDGQVKVFFMPHTVYKQIEALQENPDYTFEDVPMPFDITINADGAGTKEVKYAVMPARKNTPLSATEEADFDSKKPIGEVQVALRAKTADQPAERPFDPDEVPI